MSENTNSQNCNHKCEGCSVENCGARANPQSLLIEPDSRSSIKKIIGVVSGKGGVGKSFVTSMLAAEMQRRGKRTAVLDGDITGPSQGKAFGITEKAYGNGELIIPAYTKGGIQVISTNMLLDSDDTPVLWRGPMVANILKQFYQEVLWKDVDIMFVDMPPGTSDVPLTLFQSFRLDGIIVVTSPQELVSMIVEKAINMAATMNIRVLGLIENMSYVECPNCKERIYVFGESHIDDVAAKYDLPILARVPLDPAIAKASDAGTIEDLEIGQIKEAADFIENI
ncbi:MAG: Mrp/NBP35 family ATP-binding protein [Erysipelotrichaceae bacterium]|nr:Mrp/NBP35 family ATP-binding protein [Erysipelotrichaceae bacterium]